MEKTRLLGKTPAELKEIALAAGLPGFTGKQIAQWIYGKRVRTIAEMTNISKAGRERLEERYEVGVALPLDKAESVDGTCKYLFPVNGDPGNAVEAVMIPDGDRKTLCVSSQAGCKMGCKFCMTGRQGFQGNCSATDILNQIYALPEWERLTNIVFMGQGEPMDNLDAVLRATELLMASYSLGWSPRRITVSTVGIRGAVEEFVTKSPCHLAVSLHNAFPQQRLEMMPAEHAYGMEELLRMLAKYDWNHQRRLSFEYIVFRGLNDSPRHSKELVRLLSPLRGVRVNLIRFHTIPDTPYEGAPEERMIQMRDFLTLHGITCTIRASRGEDIFAACGLLNSKRD